MCQKRFVCFVWFVKFHEASFLLDDAPWSGRPVEADSNQMETLIENNQCLSIWRDRCTCIHMYNCFTLLLPQVSENPRLRVGRGLTKLSCSRNPTALVHVSPWLLGWASTGGRGADGSLMGSVSRNESSMCAHVQSIPGPLSVPPSPREGTQARVSWPTCRQKTLPVTGRSPHSRPVSWGLVKTLKCDDDGKKCLLYLGSWVQMIQPDESI